MAGLVEGDIIVLATALILLIAGLVIHLFIIVVNVNDWLKGRSVTPVDHIVASLGISRMCTQCYTTIYVYVVRFFVGNHDYSVTMYIMDLVFAFFSYVNFWLTSFLSIAFCVKISTLRTRLFLYLRRMIEQRTVYCILVVLLFCAISNLFQLSRTSKVMKGRAFNVTMENQLSDCSYVDTIYIVFISAFIPLLFCCITSSLLFSSLYHHITKMKMSGNLSINLETYYSAMNFISLTFIYNIIYFTGYFVDLLYYDVYCTDLVWLYIVLGFLPALHSSYLIYRTAKLRSQMSKVLHNVINLLFQRKNPETRSNIESVAQ